MARRTRISVADARRMFLGAQGLLDDPERRGGPARVRAIVDGLGFVQVDSINTVTRAQHLTLGARLDAYRPPMLRRLLEQTRELFENWTHDASVIPTRWFAHWRPVFEDARQRIQDNAWWSARLGGDPQRALAEVLARVAREGPLSSRDFERGDGPVVETGWWGWKPAKAALEHLWRTGALSVVRRGNNFEKIYDLTERVLPEAHAREAPERTAHLEWAMSSALARLGVATPTELAAYWRVRSLEDARAWCDQARGSGAVIEVEVEAIDGSTRRAYAAADWRARLARCGEAPPRMRLLGPFDPIIRDRARALRLFGFDYRFEAFVPEPKRQYGYYVLPLLQGERLVGRTDAKHHRDRALLELKAVWWERGAGPARPRRGALEAAAARLAAQLGARDVAVRDKR